VTVYFDVYLPELHRWVQKGFKARVYEIDGVRFRLFRTGTLAKCLGRTNKTISNWEKAGKLPKPIFTVVDTKLEDDINKRWYSEKQIRMMQKHMREILSDRLTKTKTPTVDHEAFFAAVRRDWYVDFDEEAA